MPHDTLTLNEITYERHAYSAVFPLMAAEDYALLLASIQESGQRVSIKLIDDRFVFDGWNRLRACVDLGIDPVFEHISANQDLQALTIALNLAHRHLTAGQKGLIAGQLATMAHGGSRAGTGAWQKRLDARNSSELSQPNSPPNNADEHQDPILDLDAHIDDQSPGTDEARLTEPTNAPSKQSETQTTPAPANTIKSASERLGISRATAAMGKRVAESGDETLLEAVKSGDLSLAAGYEIAKSPREEHHDRVKSALANGKEWLKTHKKPRELADKVAKSVLKGDPLPEGLTEAQITSVFLRVADAIVVGTLSGANCVDSQANHFTESHFTQFAAAHKRLGEALARHT